MTPIDTHPFMVHRGMVLIAQTATRGEAEQVAAASDAEHDEVAIISDARIDYSMFQD